MKSKSMKSNNLVVEEQVQDAGLPAKRDREGTPQLGIYFMHGSSGLF